MLTSDLAQSWQRGDRVRPLYIAPDDPDYLQSAADLIRLFCEHEGEPRRALDEALQEYVGVGTDYKVMRGFIKLLTDRCTFETACAKDPVEIRRALFLKARSFHPVTGDEGARNIIVEETARELDCPPEVVTGGLYADLPENQRLAGFDSPETARELLDLYNLAQSQALLYRAVEMHIYVEPQGPDAYRELFGAIKAYRLIHTIKGSASKGYEVRLDGPVSMFHRSQKYGVQMAVFLPALLLCKGWRMRALIAPQQSQSGRGSAFYELGSDQKRLRSHYTSAYTFENQVSEKLAANWGRLETEWRLTPGREVMDLGESAFIPDFVLVGPEGRKFYLEVLGFWTPDHLKERLGEFEHAGRKDFLLAASDELRGSRDPLTRVPAHTLVFKTSLDPVAVEMAVRELISQEG